MPLERINGTMLYYETYGEGVPIVFIHPPLISSANFRYQQMQLSDEFQVITFDIRGHGRSEPSQTPVTYPLICEDILRLMDRLNIEKAFLCGYSTGGSIALEAMLSYPDRFRGGILISAMSEASDFYLRGRIHAAIGLSSWKAAIRLLTLGVTWGNSDSMATFRRLMKDALKGDWRNIRQYYKYSLNYNCTNRLHEIDAPILLMFGGKDKSFKRYCHLLQKGLRKFKLITFREENHRLPTLAADKTNQMIRSWIRNEMRRNDQAVPEETIRIPEAYIIGDQAAMGAERPENNLE
ncbi:MULTISPECIES: alpha/beta fold hydrolase [unclassified Paenibacillus]|uniref:alpha/beta fold hydrolase n=1 Tax=unclassified Paenibacillus TaxID=185978 RepID=UPI001C11BAC2|nr:MULTISPECIES: alpha/beta hydrolase [unclassified Paenibacillus]MBU5444966.1 alpha/beta hydrolase [Paenibacillus sp. MSJ-34]CAH0121268.1 AB hydrolase superfamily protein YvaM [Paenibacillus sp. CECT 9249]